jgi:hypothetical protein
VAIITRKVALQGKKENGKRNKNDPKNVQRLSGEGPARLQCQSAFKEKTAF